MAATRSNLNSRGLPPTDASPIPFDPAGVADAHHPTPWVVTHGYSDCVPSGQMNSSPRRAPGQVRSPIPPSAMPESGRGLPHSTTLRAHPSACRVQAPAFGLRQPSGAFDKTRMWRASTHNYRTMPTTPPAQHQVANAINRLLHDAVKPPRLHCDWGACAPRVCRRTPRPPETTTVPTHPTVHLTCPSQCSTRGTSNCTRGGCAPQLRPTPS